MSQKGLCILESILANAQVNPCVEVYCYRTGQQLYLIVRLYLFLFLFTPN